MQRSNFHTHTKYSDGINTVEEMIERAISLGFHSLGFTDHSYTRTQPWYCMNPVGEEAAFNEVALMKEKYAGKIRIYNGIELDAESGVQRFDYDYTISSVHELVRGSVSRAVDHTPEAQQEMIDDFFGSDPIEHARGYFSAVVNHVRRMKTDIVGHVDILTKFSLIDTSNPAYREVAVNAVTELASMCNTFEMNTGAISRGYRTTPYPEDFLLRHMHSLGCRVMITSDCHNRDYLTCHFDECERILSSMGFKKNENARLNDRVSGIEIWESE